jgi:uncharacterized protein
MTNNIPRINTEAELRALIGEPTALVQSKITNRIVPLARTYIERSPLVCLATSNAAGDCDVTPRGDPAGFVQILDEKTLLLPERPGNRLADALRNILSNPHVGLLFIIPGVSDTLRVNGRAFLTTDATLLARCSVENKVPKLGIVAEIDEVFTQCSKAFLRSDFWNPANHVDPKLMPTGGQMLASINGDIDAPSYDEARSQRYARREGFY